MRRLVLAAAVLVIAACATNEQPADTSALDTSPAMAPAPSDTGDTTKMDTTKTDTTRR